MTNRDDLIERLKEAAAKATPGPWRVFQTKHKRIDNQWHVGPGMYSVAHIPTWGSDEPRASNAAYIALCSPDNILSLIDRLATLQSELDEARGVLRAIVDTLDAEEIGEGPPAAEWTSHWQGLHERARAATRTTGGEDA